MERTTLKQKIALILLGVFLCAILLEIGLRLAGFVLLARQEHQNLRLIEQKNVYRILCLGESTTQMGGINSYPRQLENILNEKDLGVNFHVINLGVSGTSTINILSHLEDNLRQYDPDMVVAMMGINDGDYSMGVMEEIPDKSLQLFFKTLRIVKLAKLLNRHIDHRFKEKEPEGIDLTMDLRQKIDHLIHENIFTDYAEGIENDIRNNPGNTEAYVLLSEYYRHAGNFNKAKELLKAAIELDPKVSDTYLNLATEYKNFGKTDKADKMTEIFGELLVEDLKINLERDEVKVLVAKYYTEAGMLDKVEGLLKEAIGINPGNIEAYEALADFYLRAGNFDKTEELIKDAIERNPVNYELYLKVAYNYVHINVDHVKAEQTLTKAIEINPERYEAYLESAVDYQNQGDLNRADEMFVKAESLIKKSEINDPENNETYRAYANYFKKRGKYGRYTRALERAIELNPKSHEAIMELIKYYRDTGKNGKAEKVLKKVIESDPADDWAYGKLGRHYRLVGNNESAEGMVSKALQLNKDNKEANEDLSVLLYRRQVIKKKPIGYFQEIDEVSSQYYKPLTIQNFRALQEKMVDNGIELVLVQYPMRSAEPLKKIFNDQRGVVFVDNEQIFKSTVAKEGYMEYFIDKFGGDFGHCSPKGNKLLAGNIADAIVNEYFNN